MSRPPRSTLALAALALAVGLAGSQAATAAEPPTYMVQVDLVVASDSGSGDLADLPAVARRALEEVDERLPFASYRLLDTALVRTSRGARTRLRGDDDRGFLAIFSVGGEPPESRLTVRSFELHEIVLRPAPAPPADPESAGTAVESTTRHVLSSSFSVPAGETVVVGTSRLDGVDGALIVLLTALP